MKNIELYKADKYYRTDYEDLGNGIYRDKKTYNYVVSISYEQEPFEYEQELGEYIDGETPKVVLQYPLEDILDTFNVFETDYYDRVNEENPTKCFVELCSENRQDVEKLLVIIGKRVYNKEQNGNMILIIE